MKLRFVAGFFGIMMLASVFFGGVEVFAVVNSDTLGITNVGGSDLETATGLSGTDPRIVAAKVINAALGVLGIIFTVLVVYAGFLWMTAAGNEENITKAKGILTASIIGLVIILMAYGISSFVIDQLLDATT